MGLSFNQGRIHLILIIDYTLLKHKQSLKLWICQLLPASLYFIDFSKAQVRERYKWFASKIWRSGLTPWTTKITWYTNWKWLTGWADPMIFSKMGNKRYYCYYYFGILEECLSINSETNFGSVFIIYEIKRLVTYHGKL